MDSDKKYLDKVMNMNKRDFVNNYFCWLYLFTNENVSAFYDYLNFKDKNVLTVTSSGDHMLNAYLRGANSVESFDVNPLAKYFSELKIAAIKSLTREEFLMFFNKNLGLFNKSKYFFSENLYRTKIREELDIDNKYFWDYLFENYDNKKIRKSNLFTNDVLFLEEIIKVNDYLFNDEKYYKLRNILVDKKVNYYDMSIKDIDKINKKYEIIILSNIANFLDKLYEKDYLKNFRGLIKKLCVNNTRVVVSYLYNNGLKYGSYSEIPIYRKKEVEQYFKLNEFEYISFPSSEEDYFPKLLLKENNEDQILVNKEK